MRTEATDADRFALEDVELWAQATDQQLQRVADHLRGGAFFTWDDPKALRYDADVHLLVVAAEQLRKALAAAPDWLELGQLPDDWSELLTLVRHVLEHRDEALRDRRAGRPPRRSAKKLAKALAARGDKDHHAFSTTWDPTASPSPESFPPPSSSERYTRC